MVCDHALIPGYFLVGVLQDTLRFMFVVWGFAMGHSMKESELLTQQVVAIRSHLAKDSVNAKFL